MSALTPPATNLVLRLAPALNTAYSDAGSTLCLNGERIRQLNDLSGNNYHCSQATAANRPVFFDGACRFWLTDGFTPAQLLNCHASLPVSLAGTSIYWVASHPYIAEGNGRVFRLGNIIYPNTSATQSLATNYGYYSDFTMFRNKAAYAYILDGTHGNLKLVRDGNTYTSGAFGATDTGTGGTIGNDSSSDLTFQCYFDLYEMLIYSDVDATRHAQVMTYLQNRHGTGVTETARIVIGGDSISVGTGSTYNQSWDAVMRQSLSRGTYVYSCAYPGKKLADEISDYPTLVRPRKNSAVTSNVYILYLGTNSIATGSTAASAAAQLQTLVNLAKADGFKVIVCSPTPRSAGPYTEMIDFAARCLQITGADAIVDLFNDPMFGPYGDSNPMMIHPLAGDGITPDFTHPFDIGHARIAQRVNEAYKTVTSSRAGGLAWDPANP
jgi:hypothetical protein